MFNKSKIPDIEVEFERNERDVPFSRHFLIANILWIENLIDNLLSRGET